MNTATGPEPTVLSPLSPNFSPAPWKLNQEDLTVKSITDGIVHMHAFTERTAQDEANAQLIAAAPELLEACQDAHDWMEHILSHQGLASIVETRVVAGKCSAAIAKSVTPDDGVRTISDDELVEVRPVIAFEVWVRLKKSSKYYGQGQREDGKAAFFKLDGFEPQKAMGLMSDRHLLRFNNNSYRREDCEFFLVDPKNTRAFVRVA